MVPESCIELTVVSLPGRVVGVAGSFFHILLSDGMFEDMAQTPAREKSESGGNQPDSVDTEPHSGSALGPFHSQDSWIISLLLLSAFGTKVSKAYLESTLASHTILHSNFLEYTEVYSLLQDSAGEDMVSSFLGPPGAGPVFPLVLIEFSVR